MRPWPQNPNGSRPTLTLDKSVVQSGGEIEITGPPGESVAIATFMRGDDEVQVTLDKTGKAKVRLSGPPRDVVVFLLSDFSASRLVEVVQTLP